MIKFLIPMLLISNIAFAGISVCQDGDGKITNFSLRGSSIEGCLYYDSGYNVTPAQYSQIKALFETVPRYYIKIVEQLPFEMNASEKAVVDAERAAEAEALENAAIDRIDVSPLKAFTALIQVINIRLPAGQKITKQELINQIKANRV